MKGIKTGLTTSLTVVAALSLSACSLLGGGNDRRERLAYVERPAEQLYNQAADRMEARDFDQAKLLFEEVERQHPFSEWARRSMLMSAFASYTTGEYEDAIATSQRFISLHPGNESTPYAYYLTAMSYYDQIYDVGRDQGTTTNAEAALQQVVRRYPESDYARDARLKLELTRDHLAGKEMSVGRYYLRDNQHLAAIGRFKNVVRNYDTTSHVEEAMHRLVESYVSLGVLQEARLVGSVLAYNYPGSDWYAESYALLEDFGIDLDAEVGREDDPTYFRRLRERLF